MFNKEAKLKQRIEDLEAEIEAQSLELNRKKDQVAEVQRQVDRIEHKNKVAQEDLEHMMKLKEERLNVEFEKKTLELEKQKAEEIAQVKDQYRDKLETQLNKEVDRIQEMYGQILERLPDVTARLRGKIDG